MCYGGFMHEKRPEPPRLYSLEVFRTPRNELPQQWIVDIDDRLRDDWAFNGWTWARYMIPTALVVLCGFLLKAIL